jgi:hypothetical protein
LNQGFFESNSLNHWPVVDSASFLRLYTTVSSKYQIISYSPSEETVPTLEMDASLWNFPG